MDEKVGRMRDGIFIKLAVIVGFVLGLYCSCIADTKRTYDIRVDEQTIRLNAGILQRSIKLDGANTFTKSLSVDGKEMLTGPADEVSFTIHFALPNERPKGIEPGMAPASVEALDDPNAVITDILIVKKNKGYEVKQAVQWVDPIRLSGRTWSRVFDMVVYHITKPKPGIKRLNVRARAARSGKLRGLSVDLFYEVYQGHDTIRKWVEIRNNSPYWIKVDQLLIDDMELAGTYRHRTDLTPAGRGATASVAALGADDGSIGLIAVNEIPSALHVIHDNGSMGYVNDYFEWVIGPAECFVSEPVFFYAYAGDVIPTVSAVSTPRDRTVEGPYMDFLQEHILLPVDHAKLPAPMWCSWANLYAHFTQEQLYEQVDIAAKIGLAGVQIDAGWGLGDCWEISATEPNPAKFPDLDAAAKYVQDKGLHLGCWISCIREKTQKDYEALPYAASQPLVARGSGFGMSYASPWRHYFADDVVYMHDRYGITYIKQDLSNICFGDIAEGHDSRTHKESFLRGLRGLLESQLDIHRRAPDLVTLLSHEIVWQTPGPGCDVASLKHAVSYHTSPNDYGGTGNRKEPVSDKWIDDPKCEPERMRRDLLESAYNCRLMLYRHRGLPLYRVEYLGATMTHYRGSLTEQIVDRQICSWLLGIPNVYQGDLTSLTPALMERYRKRFDTLKRLENQYGIYGHFQFSGVPEPTEKNWHWWGKLNPKGYGVVVVLRGTEGPDQRKINIPWVVPNRKYDVRALFDEHKLGTFTGEQLQNGALILTLDRLSQDILEILPIE